MRRRTNMLPILALITGLAVGGCTDEQPLGVSPGFDPDIREPALSIMTWNLYVGARLADLLLVQDPNQIPFEAAKIFAHVQATDFPSRAEVIADRIAERRPHVVSLQEMSRFRIQSPGDFLLGNPLPASDVALDFLEVLQDALVARGLSYRVAAYTQNFDVELPMVNFATGGLDDIRLTDFDLILVRKDRAYSNPSSGNFQAVLPISLGGATIPKPSGWASVDITMNGQPVRIVNTHLEAADVAPGVVDPQLAALQAAQAAELASILDQSPIPVFLTGDLNSAADGSSTPTYRLLRDLEFHDAWLRGGGPGRGFTANQAPDLLNIESELFHRIDFILFRGAQRGRGDLFRGPIHVELLGEEQADRTAGGLWPSDHAGIYLAIPEARADG